MYKPTVHSPRAVPYGDKSQVRKGRREPECMGSAFCPLCLQQQPGGSTRSRGSTEGLRGAPRELQGSCCSPCHLISCVHLSTDRSQGRQLQWQTQSSELVRLGSVLTPELNTATSPAGAALTPLTRKFPAGRPGRSQARARAELPGSSTS